MFLLVKLCFICDIYAQETSIFVSTYLNERNELIIDRLPKKYSKLVVDKTCDLAGKCLRLPASAELCIEQNGLIDNGIIQGRGNSLSVLNIDKPVIGCKLRILGEWKNQVVFDSWFCFDKSPSFVSNDIIKNILSLTDGEHFCHIYFQADRTYYFELPYKGETNFGDKVSFTMSGNKKKRKWSDLNKNEYSFLRIFTIPSNTHLTIDNRFQMLPTNQGVYYIFWEYGKQNITIDGKGCIAGDAKNHIYNSPIVKGSKYYGEWGYIFCCQACSNFKFSGITLEYAFGDCISYTADYSNENIRSRVANDLLIDNLKIRYARRNGVTVAATNVIVQNTFFEGCGTNSIHGTAPKSAIDFEPDEIRQFPEIGNVNVQMRYCRFINNIHDVSSTFNNLYDYGKIVTRISNCIFTAPIRLNTTNWIEFSNCVIPDITNYQNKIANHCPVRQVLFKQCHIKKMPRILFLRDWYNNFEDCQIDKIYE